MNLLTLFFTTFLHIYDSFYYMFIKASNCGSNRHKKTALNSGFLKFKNVKNENPKKSSGTLNPGAIPNVSAALLKHKTSAM